jgi:hypothetical protein
MTLHLVVARPWFGFGFSAYNKTKTPAPIEVQKEIVLVAHASGHLLWIYGRADTRFCHIAAIAIAR